MDGATIAVAFGAEVEALPVRSVDAVRRVRRAWTRRLRAEDGEAVLAAARNLRPRWAACELVRHHPAALAGSRPLVERWVGDLHDWGDVDAFARLLAGPAWLAGVLPDSLIASWAASPDRWIRRSALVATVALNAKVDGGAGNAPRTLAVCAALAEDRDDMVVKALSWALRELVAREAAAVDAFLAEHDASLASRVKREVRSKLATGLKQRPRRV